MILSDTFSFVAWGYWPERQLTVSFTRSTYVPGFWSLKGFSETVSTPMMGYFGEAGLWGQLIVLGA